MSDNLTLVCVCVYCMCMTVLSYVVGGSNGMEIIRKEAISHGYASYEIVDQKTGKTEFKWKGQGK